MVKILANDYVKRYYGDIELVAADEVAKMLGIYVKGQAYESRLNAKIWLHRHKIKGVFTYMSQKATNHWNKADVLKAIAEDREREGSE